MILTWIYEEAHYIFPCTSALLDLQLKGKNFHVSKLVTPYLSIRQSILNDLRIENLNCTVHKTKYSATVKFIFSFGVE